MAESMKLWQFYLAAGGSLEAEYDIHALKIDGYHKGTECRTSIWTRLKVSKRLQTHDPETAVCVEIESDAGQVLVYATVIPYENAGVKDICYRSNSLWHVDQKNWGVHLGSIERHGKELRDLRSSHDKRPFVLGGDFNHHRFEDSRYGSAGRDKLTETLDEVNLSCVTERDFRKLDGESAESGSPSFQTRMHFHGNSSVRSLIQLAPSSKRLHRPLVFTNTQKIRLICVDRSTSKLKQAVQEESSMRRRSLLAHKILLG